ncbi:amino acid ABC transporter permease [Amycolatopsis sp. NPDC098790]|uniref:amino acid ABC transporter permease n=1 Tax=Amycolatopsis sp. NPDC098790 TaxID=3363939 RepID=UPI0037F4BD64
MSVLFDHLGELLTGLLVTLELAVLAFPLAVVVGTLLGVFRVGPVGPLRAVAGFYVQCLRNSPLLLVLVMVVFGLPYVGATVPLFGSVVLGLGLYFGAYVCETVRSGISAVPTGQIEAARALGLTFAGVLRQVVLPQAFRSMAQPLGSIFINVCLASALGAAVGVQELTGSARQFNLDHAQPIPSFVAAAIGYLLITLTAGQLTGVIERKVRIRR